MAAVKGDDGGHPTEDNRPSGSALGPGNPASTDIKVMILPMNGNARMIYLPTTDTSTKKRLSPASLKSLIEATANAPGAKFLVQHCLKGLYQPTARIQPDPRIQPDTGRGYWSDDAWAQRFVLAGGGGHLLFTAKEDGSPPNPYLGAMCHGDAFILGFTKTKGSDGQMVYRSLTPEQESEFVENSIEAFRSYQGAVVACHQSFEQR